MSWFTRFLNVVRRDSVSRELDEELEFHLAARTEDLVAGGMAPERARQAARRQLGNMPLFRESSRDIKLLPRLESVLQDIAFGFRLCRRNGVVTAAAVVSLSLAIGACTAAFSLVDALILRPLPVKDPERLIYVAQRVPERHGMDSVSTTRSLKRCVRPAARKWGYSGSATNRGGTQSSTTPADNQRRCTVSGSQEMHSNFSASSRLWVGFLQHPMI